MGSLRLQRGRWADWNLCEPISGVGGTLNPKNPRPPLLTRQKSLVRELPFKISRARPRIDFPTISMYTKIALLGLVGSAAAFNAPVVSPPASQSSSSS